MEFQLIVRKLAFLIIVSISAGLFFVKILGKHLNLDQSVDTIIRVSVVAFIIFSVPIIVLPLITGHYK